MKRKKKQNLRPIKPLLQVRLTPEELLEFKLRRSVLDQSRGVYLMVEEAHLEWCKKIRDKYGLSAKFDVDLMTGVVREQANG